MNYILQEYEFGFLDSIQVLHNLQVNDELYLFLKLFLISIILARILKIVDACYLVNCRKSSFFIFCLCCIIILIFDLVLLSCRNFCYLCLLFFVLPTFSTGSWCSY